MDSPRYLNTIFKVTNSIMKLLLQLQEAADIPLDQLKDVLKKDKRLKGLFSRDPKISDIKNPKEFLETLKFYVLNNRHLLQLMNDREGISGNLPYKQYMTSLRKLTVDQLDNVMLTMLRNTVKGILDEVKDIESAKIDEYILKELRRISHEGGVRHMYPQSLTKLQSIKWARPTKPVFLYLGLHLSSNYMEANDFALTLLRSVREGTRTIDLNLENASAWRRTKLDAVRDALDAERWDGVDEGADLSKVAIKRLRKDDVGLVLSARILPEQVVIDTAALTEHGLDPAVIVKGGKILARVLHKFTAAGEVDPSVQDTGSVDHLPELVSFFADIFAYPFSNVKIVSSYNIDYDGPQPAQIRDMLDPAKHRELISAWDSLAHFYETSVKDAKDIQLLELEKNPDNLSAVNALRVIKNVVPGVSLIGRHNDKAGRFTGQQLFDSAREDAERRLTRSVNALKTIFPPTSKRFVDEAVGTRIEKILKGISSVTFPRKFHTLAHAKQVEIVKAVLAEFWTTLGEQRSGDSIDSQLARLLEVIITADQIVTMLRPISRVGGSLVALKSDGR